MRAHREHQKRPNRRNSILAAIACMAIIAVFGDVWQVVFDLQDRLLYRALAVVVGLSAFMLVTMALRSARWWQTVIVCICAIVACRLALWMLRPKGEIVLTVTSADGVPSRSAEVILSGRFILSVVR